MMEEHWTPEFWKQGSYHKLLTGVAPSLADMFQMFIDLLLADLDHTGYLPAGEGLAL